MNVSDDVDTGRSSSCFYVQILKVKRVGIDVDAVSIDINAGKC
jgi:hypothetical protein